MFPRVPSPDLTMSPRGQLGLGGAPVAGAQIGATVLHRFLEQSPECVVGDGLGVLWKCGQCALPWREFFPLAREKVTSYSVPSIER